MLTDRPKLNYFAKCEWIMETQIEQHLNFSLIWEVSLGVKKKGIFSGYERQDVCIGARSLDRSLWCILVRGKHVSPRTIADPTPLVNIRLHEVQFMMADQAQINIRTPTITIPHCRHPHYYPTDNRLLSPRQNYGKCLCVLPNHFSLSTPPIADARLGLVRNIKQN